MDAQRIRRVANSQTTYFDVDWYLGADGQSVGSALTTAALGASTVSLLGSGTWSLFRNPSSGYWSGTDLPRRTPLRINGALLGTSGSGSIRYDLSGAAASTYEIAAWAVAPSLQRTGNVSVSCVCTMNGQGLGSAIDLLRIKQEMTPWTVGQWRKDTVVSGSFGSYFWAHGQSGGSSTFGNQKIFITSNTVYHVTALHNASRNLAEVAVVGSDGTLIGHSACKTDISTPLYSVAVNSYLTFGGGEQWVDNVAIATGPKACIPMERTTVPAATNVIACQVASNYIVLKYGGPAATATLTTNGVVTMDCLLAPYWTNSTAVDGVTYQCGVSAYVGTNTSSAVYSSVTVDDTIADVGMPVNPTQIETFEGSGYWEPDWIISGTGVDPDYTADVLFGTQSLYCYRASFASSFIYKSISGGEVWRRFLYKGSAAEGIPFFQIKNSATILCQLSVVGGKLRVTAESAGTDSVATFSASTKYTIWVHYKKGTGSDGIAEAWFSTGRDFPGSSDYYTYKTDSTRTQDANTIFFGQIGSSTSGSSWAIFDNVVGGAAQF